MGRSRDRITDDPMDGRFRSPYHKKSIESLGIRPWQPDPQGSRVPRQNAGKEEEGERGTKAPFAPVQPTEQDVTAKSLYDVLPSIPKTSLAGEETIEVLAMDCFGATAEGSPPQGRKDQKVYAGERTSSWGSTTWACSSIIPEVRTRAGTWDHHRGIQLGMLGGGHTMENASKIGPCAPNAVTNNQMPCRRRADEDLGSWKHIGNQRPPPGGIRRRRRQLKLLPGHSGT